jgi:hypothetical protein
MKANTKSKSHRIFFITSPFCFHLQISEFSTEDEALSSAIVRVSGVSRFTNYDATPNKFQPWVKSTQLKQPKSKGFRKEVPC